MACLGVKPPPLSNLLWEGQACRFLPLPTVPRAVLCPSPGVWASALGLPPTGSPWAAQGGGSILRARPTTALPGSVSMRSWVPSYS